MASDNLVFRVHAIQRMVQRQITVDEVRNVLRNGEVIENYPDDTPYPTRLVLGRSGLRYLHVVAADQRSHETIVITVYEPNLTEWEPGFKRRRL